MKNLIKTISCILLTAVIFSACKKEISTISYTGGTAPLLTASTTAAIVLDSNFRTAPALTLSWTNPNYQFTTGLSSQDVTYTLQIDSAGKKFSSSALLEQKISKDLSQSFTVGDLNKLLANWQYETPTLNSLEVRIKSSLGPTGAVPLYSNVTKITVTTFLEVVVALPSSGQLFLIGNATPGGEATGWNNPVPAPSQQFLKPAVGVYEITIPLIGGKNFLAIPVNGSWDHKYAVDNADPTVSSTGGNFGFDKGDNFPGPTASGIYKITLNFKSGKFSVVKQ